LGLPGPHARDRGEQGFSLADAIVLADGIRQTFDDVLKVQGIPIPELLEACPGHADH
jgi:hypothetical protein